MMLARVLCRMGQHEWKDAGGVYVYGPGKWIGPFMMCVQPLIKVKQFRVCLRCGASKSRTHDVQGGAE